DTFDYTLGACLSQKDDQGCMHPVIFLSQKFSPVEFNYQIHDKKLIWLLLLYVRNGDSTLKKLLTLLLSTLITKISFTLQLRKNSINIKYISEKSSAHTISTLCISLDKKIPVLIL